MYLVEQMKFKVIYSVICNWSAYVSYLIKKIRAQIVFNQLITDVRIS